MVTNCTRCHEQILAPSESTCALNAFVGDTGYFREQKNLGSNPVIGNFISLSTVSIKLYRKDENKEKEGRNGPNFKRFQKQSQNKMLLTFNTFPIPMASHTLITTLES